MKAGNTQTSVNSVTDPGFLFGLGNGFATIKQSFEAGVINLTMGAVCLVVRGVSELRAAGYNIPLPRTLEKFVVNPGSALAVSGVFNLGAAGIAATTIDPARPETVIPATIMTCFGVANMTRGLASGLSPGSLRQRFLDVTGIVAANTGLVIAAPDAPIAIKSIYAVAAGMGIYLSIRNRPPHGAVQPDLTNAVAASMSAATSATPEFAAANAIWSGAYLSIAALKKRGGVFQIFTKDSGLAPG